MPDNKPLRISWSRLKTWEECQAKGKLLADYGRPSTADIRGFFPGTVIDRCMRDWLNAPAQEPGWMAAKVDEIMDREEALAHETGDGTVRWKGPEDRNEVREWCKLMCIRLEPVLFQWVVPFEYQPALRFEVPMDIGGRSALLTGEMDVLVRYPQDIQESGLAAVRVFDLKGTKSTDYWKQTFPQLGFYELACWGMKLGWPVQSYLIQPHFDPPQNLLPFTFTMEHRTQLLARVYRYAESWWAGNFPPKADNAGCDRCVVRNMCPKFRGTGKRATIGTPV